MIQIPIRIWHNALAPLLPPMCRFHPSCSVYALQALDSHPVHRAAWLISRRLLRCQPFHPGGFDPVPHPHRSPRSADRRSPHS